MRMYEIADEVAAVLAKLEDAGGVLTPELEAEYDAAFADMRAKMEGTAHVVLNMEAEAKALREEAARLAERARAVEKRCASLKGYVMRCMGLAGVTSMRAGLAQWRIQRNSRPSLRPLVAVEELPEAYRRVKVEFDSQAAYEAWKRGELPESIEATVGEHVRLS